MGINQKFSPQLLAPWVTPRQVAPVASQLRPMWAQSGLNVGLCGLKWPFLGVDHNNAAATVIELPSKSLEFRSLASEPGVISGASVS